jgi:hypothetical protein
MRIAGIEKLGYYPTPPVVTQAIARWFTAPAVPWRALDPCAGMGEALAQFTLAVGGECETWGVELAPARAEAAARY